MAVYESIATDLVLRGADPSIFRDQGDEWFGYNAVHMAVYAGKLKVISAMNRARHARLRKAINARIERGKGGNPGMTPLLIAVGRGYTDIALELLELGADPSIRCHPRAI